MANLSDVKHRIKGISQTRQITSAMETISISKMRKALERYDSNKLYFDTIRSTIRDIVLHTKDVMHPYLQKGPGERAVYIVIASDKGLAGGYNHNVLTAAWEEISAREDKYIFTIGQVAREFFEYRKIETDGEFLYLTKDPSMRDAKHITKDVMAMYDKNMMDEVHLVYTAMEAHGEIVPQTIRLLPLMQEDIYRDLGEEDVNTDYDMINYEPSAEDVLARLVPQYLEDVIYGALVQSVACEHSSRRLAMSNATKNATKILDKLNILYNRARQEAVTSELTEIITSSMGVK